MIRLLLVLVAETVQVLAAAEPCSLPSRSQTAPIWQYFLSQNRSQHESGDTKRPYSYLMKQQGVVRAFFEVDSVWRHDRPQDVHIVHRLYFRSYEGPDAQVVDERHLDEIRQSGLESLLDQTTLNRMNSAHLFAGPEGIRHPEGKAMYTYLEFFEDPSREERPTLASPYDKHAKLDPLWHAAYIGDAIELTKLLRNQEFSRERLNAALFTAVRNNYDNTAVINLLLHAGGDIHARTEDGQTLLMVAIGIPVQVKALLKMGVNVNDRDRYGNTALKLAEQSHAQQCAQLLRQAGATE